MMTKQSLLFYSFAETAYSHCRKKCEEYCSYVMRPINSMVEFKQIIGRGTRLFDGKEYFTMYDFVGAYKNFSYPQWDGEPIELIELPELPAKPSKLLKSPYAIEENCSPPPRQNWKLK